MEKFCEVYEELYNSAESTEALNALKEQISEDVCGEASLLEVCKISGDIVK